jgi:O-methyltransferase/methyltransferase family protein
MDPSRELLHMVNGYQVSQALHVAATLGISDLLASGPRDVTDLAEATGTHGPTLLRLMRALESVDVYSCDEEGRYENTALGKQLCGDVPGSILGWATYVGRPYYRQAWTGLLDSVRTGDNAFASVHGTSCWSYRREHPEEQVIFDGAMTATAGVVVDAVAGSYDFARFDTVADLGGGVGTLLTAILERNPKLHGVLFDQPDVVADAAPVLQAAGVTDRCRLVGGSFFESVPAGADAYLLKAVIHDWLDAEAIQILSTCRRAMRDDATVLLVEQLLGRGPDPVQTAFSDLNMLVSPGGQERTLEQYRALLAASGLSLTGVTETGTPVFVIEAAPAA